MFDWLIIKDLHRFNYLIVGALKNDEVLHPPIKNFLTIRKNVTAFVLKDVNFLFKIRSYIANSLVELYWFWLISESLNFI